MAGPRPVTAWFLKEVLPWRVYDAILRSSILQFLTLFGLFLFACLRDFSPLSPLSSLWRPLRGLLTPSSWLYDLLVASSLAVFCALMSRRPALAPSVRRSRASHLADLLEPGVLSALASVGLVGAVLTRCYLGLWGGPFNAMSAPCMVGSMSRCLNEPHFFIVFSGFVMGALLGRDLCCDNGNLLVFPQVQMRGTSQLKMRLLEIAKESGWFVALGMRWSLAAYLITGRRLVMGLGSIIRTNVDSTDWESIPAALWTVLYILYTTYMLNFLLVFSLRTTMEILAITLMKPLPLPVDGDRSGIEAMEQQENELLQHLAFYDFENFSNNDQQRRSFVFQLSDPGGHPRNWNRICDACLKVVNEFIAALNATSQSKVSSTLPSATADDLRTRHPHLRLRSQQQSLSAPVVIPAPKAASKSYVPKPLALLWQKVNKNSLFAPFPDAASRAVFAKSQIVIWALEGMSHLVALSVFEDRYGVVQRRLGDILATFISLQQTVERHKGLTANLKRGRSEVRDAQLKQELRAAVRTSIYRIVAAFGEHISAVQMPADVKQKIDSYKNFLET